MADGSEKTIRYSKENIMADDILTSWSYLAGTEGRMRPEGIACLPGGRIVISDSANECVKMFSINGEFIGILAKKGPDAILCPGSLTSFPDGTLAVFDAGDKSIKLFSMAGRLIKSFKDEFTNCPVPLGSSKNGDVMFPYQQTIRFISIRNFETKVLPVNTSSNLSTARGLVVSRDHVICCGMSDHDLLFIDRNSGDVICTEDCLENRTIEAGLKPMFYGMCLDRAENLYIVDSDNNRIVFIQNQPTETIASYDCEEWLAQLVDSRSYHQLDMVLLCPKCICIGPDSEIIIVEHLGKVKRLNMKNKMATVIRSLPVVDHEDDLLFNPGPDINVIEPTIQGRVLYKCCL